MKEGISGTDILNENQIIASLSLSMDGVKIPIAMVTEIPFYHAASNHKRNHAEKKEKKKHQIWFTCFGAKS